jgi:hypothetical protein
MYWHLSPVLFVSVPGTSNFFLFHTFAVFWMLYFFWVIPGVWILYTDVSGPSECSETLAYKIQTPGNHPKERIQRITFVPNGREVSVPRVHNTRVSQGRTQRRGGRGVSRLQPYPPNRNLYNTDCVDKMILNFLRYLPFNWNQPLKSADD